jgi:hypothetical protein
MKQFLLSVLVAVALLLGSTTKSMAQTAAPTFNTTPSVTTVDYGTEYSYSFSATKEGALETTLTAPTLTAWLTFSTNGESKANLFGNVPAGVSLCGVAGDNDGNIYAMRNDQAQILKKCIDLPELQSYLMTDSEGKLQQLCINYWHPTFFPTDLSLTKGGKSIIFKEMTIDAEKAGDPFILFKTFVITGEVAKVDFEYHFGTNNCSKLLQVYLDFKKIGNDWNISKTSLTNQ